MGWGGGVLTDCRNNYIWGLLIYINIDMSVRPPLNKKWFPVYRPGGSKRADWNFFFIFSIFFFFFFTFPPVHSSLTKLKIGRKKKIPTSRLAYFSPTRFFT